MIDAEQPAWNGRVGTAGGAAFGKGLAALAAEREVSHEHLAEAIGVAPDVFAGGDPRRGAAGRLRPCASGSVRCARGRSSSLQKTAILSLEVYAFGLDPLYFLPEGQVRYDARIYMREINPRHRVPEGDMTKRNPALAALAQDEVLDALGKIEVELAYLLRAAVQQTGGTL